MAWTRSDESGAFELRGCLAAERLRVLAFIKDPGVFGSDPEDSTSAEVPFGASGVLLSVRGLGSIEGSVLLPDGVVAGDVRLAWEGAIAMHGRAPEVDVEAVAAAEPELARFQLVNAPMMPGRLDVFVGTHVVESFGDVFPSHDEATRDPRIQRMDLRNQVRLLRVFVEAPDGTPVVHGRVLTKTWNEESLFDTNWWIQRGVATCIVGAGPVDVWIDVPAARHETIQSVGQDELSVRLRKPLASDVTLEFRAEHLPTGLIASLKMPHANLILCTESTPSAGGATMHTHPESPGSYQVSLEFPPTDEGCPKRKLCEWPIVVADTEAPQNFVLEVDPRALEAALR